MVAKQKRQRTAQPAKPTAGKPLGRINIPSGIGIAVWFVVLGIVTFFRLSHLGADPPVDISWSQDLWTDPPQYTSYARNAVLFGDPNPLDENMYLPFQRSSMGVVAHGVFAVFGVGFWQSNLASVLYSIATIAIFSLAIWRLRNPLAGILTVLFLGLNYIFLTYGRVPFLENAMNFWLALAVFFLTFPPRKLIWFGLAGISLGLGAFYGKMIGLHALPALLIFAALIGWWERERDPSFRWFVPSISILIGFVIVAVIWLPTVYLQIEGSYFAEKSTGLYGAPEGLTSLGGFVNRLFSFGSDTRLFTRLPFVSILGFIGVALGFYCLTGSGSLLQRIKNGRPDYLLLGTWFWLAYLALMPWNYRPLRYQTVLLIPLAGAAALVVADLLRRWPPGSRPKKPAAAWTIGLTTLLFMLPIHHLITAHLAQTALGQANTAAVLIAIVAAIGLGLSGAFAWPTIRSTFDRLRLRTRLPEIILAAAIIGVCIIQVPMIADWWEHSQTAMTSASRDLQDLLGEDVVLTGSYATGITLENQHKNVVYMFGVTTVHHTLFDEYPITHLAVIDDKEQGRVFQDYPQIAGRARRVTSYMIGNRPVGIFRVAENSRNSQARSYEPTAWEEAMRCYDQRKEDSMMLYFDQFMASYPENFSANRFLGRFFMRDSTYDSAIVYFGRATETYPDDFAVRYNYGHCAAMLFQQTGNPADWNTAREQFAEVLRLRPNDPALRAQLEPFLSR